MATNRVFEHGTRIQGDVSGLTGSGTGGLVLAGDPVVIGNIPGVALTDEDANGNVVVQTDGVFRLPVKGETTTDTAVAVGDIVYYDGGTVNKDSSNGVRFGYALGAVSAGATTTIPVKIGY